MMRREPVPASAIISLAATTSVTKPAKKFEALARKHGFIARCGDEYVAFAPPLVIERADLDELLVRATDVLHEMVG